MWVDVYFSPKGCATVMIQKKKRKEKKILHLNILIKT